MFTVLAHFEAPWEEMEGGEGMKIKPVGLSFSMLSVLLVFFYKLSINLHFTYIFDHNGSSTGSCKRKPEVDPSQK